MDIGRSVQIAELLEKFSLQVVGKIIPSLSAQRKEQVPFKNLHKKWIYFLFGLQTISTNPKLIRISNIPLRSVGLNRELLTEKKSKMATASKLDLLTCDCELSLYPAKNIHSYGCNMTHVC